MPGPATSLSTTAVRWDGERLRILDQTLLPAREQWLDLDAGAVIPDAASFARPQIVR